MRGYIENKANRLRDIGIAAYRAGDFYGQPSGSMTPADEDAFLSAASKLARGDGFSEDKPLQGVESTTVLALLRCFHFVCKAYRGDPDHEADPWRGVLIANHVATSREVAIYVAYPSAPEPIDAAQQAAAFKRPALQPRLEYVPDMDDSTVAGSGKIGPFMYRLHTDCESTSAIEYKHVLLCYDPNERWLCYAVAVERVADEAQPGPWVLTEFIPPQRHRNLGQHDGVDDVAGFSHVAKELAETFLLSEP